MTTPTTNRLFQRPEILLLAAFTIGVAVAEMGSARREGQCVSCGTGFRVDEDVRPMERQSPAQQGRRYDASSSLPQ